MSFKVKDVGQKRTYTLSFPNAQRYDFVVISPSNQIVYKWSADKAFVETVGTTMINPGDTLGFNELLPVADFYLPLSVGEYTVQASLANYPEITAKGTLKVVPGQPLSALGGAASASVSTPAPAPSGEADHPNSEQVKSAQTKRVDQEAPLPKT